MHEQIKEAMQNYLEIDREYGEALDNPGKANDLDSLKESSGIFAHEVIARMRQAYQENPSIRLEDIFA